MTIQPTTYLKLSKFVSRMFQYLGGLELALAVLVLPLYLRAHYAWCRPLVVVGFACILLQACALALVERARTWAARSLPGVATVGQPMQGKRGYRNYGPKPKLSKRARAGMPDNVQLGEPQIIGMQTVDKTGKRVG